MNGERMENGYQLQRPQHFDEDGGRRASGEDREHGSRGGLRDILNPVSSLRSPTQESPSHHVVSGFAPPAISNAGFTAGPPNLLKAVAHLQSPLQHPPVVYPQDSRVDRGRGEQGHGRRSFYDPTTEATNPNECRSDMGTPSFRNPPQTRDPYASSFAQQASDYYSTAASTLASPASHSRPPMPGSISRSTKPAPAASSSSRQASVGSCKMANPTSPSAAGNPVGANNPNRAAGVMSFSNILSSSEPAPEVKPPSPISGIAFKSEHAETTDGTDKTRADKAKDSDASIDVNKTKDKKTPRRSTKARVSDIKSATKPSPLRRASSKQGTPAAARVVAKRQANGHAKAKAFSHDNEKRIRDLMEQLDAEHIDEGEWTAEQGAFRERSERRRKCVESRDVERHRDRRTLFALVESQRLKVHADLGKRRFDEANYEEALQQVRERELHDEKERKKDMQRKRRREKSMATTAEQQAAALARAEEARDESERQKHLREAERANKKIQQTKLILEKGIKGPARNLGPMEPNLEGGTTATFVVESMEPGKQKGKGRTGSRPKKSKEQKQAEKDAAEAAQAALDAGEELPPPREENKIRIKVSKCNKAVKEECEQEDEAREHKGKVKSAEEGADPEARFQTKGYNQIYDQILRDLARKDVNKVFRMASDSYATKASNLKKTAILASKEAKRWQLRTNKGTKDLQARAKRVMRDMMGFWKRNEREERELRKAAEKQELENARKEEADREAARQKRKLNFLISQTELYSHFIGKKIKTDEVERSTDHPEEAAKGHAKDAGTHKLKEMEEPTGPVGAKVTNFEKLDFDQEDESGLRAAAMANAQSAIAEAQKKAREFNKEQSKLVEDGEMNFQNPTGMGDVEIEQPKLLNAKLKEYQLKGLNWLANLYEQGINGILADEMGLGKTVQSISVMAYLAEKYGVWGPFLVVAPASTLHNWQQEIARFVPDFKVLPYWGTAADRKVLRKFWDRKHMTYKQDAPFHVMVTSYQMVVQDVDHFRKMRWQYMILDEAQAIKSSSSSRWKSLLSFHCRNRLLLTGTPIQNNMQELWALLHFIMPTLFDSHDEFSEWFSKDIESHAQSNTKLNEDQLKRLHMILKPFMLRRVKKHVQKELGDKIELDVFCTLTYRQRALYSSLRNQISIMDLIQRATMGEDDSCTLMNLVMQFRKVCNHPDLFERADTTSPFSCSRFGMTGSLVREGSEVTVGYSTRNAIEYSLPRLVWRDGGRVHKAGSDNQQAGFRTKCLEHMMNIWSPDHVCNSQGGSDCFSWLRLADVSPQEAYRASHQDIFARAADLAQKKKRLGHMAVAYDEPEDSTWTPAHALLNIRERAERQALANVTDKGVLNSLMNVGRARYDDDGLDRLAQAGCHKASAPPIEVYCNSRRSAMEREDVFFNAPLRKLLFGPNAVEEAALVTHNVPLAHFPPPPLLPAPDNRKKRFTNITVPSMQSFITDSGKLAKLDQLLRELKEGGHRVLLYFQMTRMIDLVEEYLTYRNYKYCRLDGSTKLEDRRDTVHDFQTRPDIFIFLLSTRAGGLGINLTSADTVIFYDSDWNPTIDSQAMDRAHRLGQTKQVMVYRLITRGTIEERIRKRAMQKEEVQRVVITGSSSEAAGGGVDFSGRRAPENRNRDIAMWLADDEQAEIIERREKEMLESGEYDKLQKKKGGKRKRAGGEASLDDMYHEGEGHFDDKASGASGAATPAEPDARPSKRKKLAGGKKAKTTKQRLAFVDGEA